MHVRVREASISKRRYGERNVFTDLVYFPSACPCKPDGGCVALTRPTISFLTFYVGRVSAAHPPANESRR